MKVASGRCAGLIPARGGSKSIPLKNLAPLAGRPLVDYNIHAARASGRMHRIVCSTDSNAIGEHCRASGVEVLERPDHLSGDSTPVIDVIRHYLEDHQSVHGNVPELVALLQPTSPFLLPEHIKSCVDQLLAVPGAGSVQTVVECPHNHHAYNQREIDVHGVVDFYFREERERSHNKQLKPKFYLFGNLLVMRSSAVLEQQAPFARPSLAVEIEWPYDLDADGPRDFSLGEALLNSGLVQLPHMDRG